MSKMDQPTRFRQFDIGLRGRLALTREDWEGLLKSEAFAAFCNTLTDPIIVFDPDEVVIFLNQAGQRVLGVENFRRNLQLATLIRQSDLDIGEFLAKTQRGKTQGFVRSPSTGKIYHTVKRTLVIVGSSGGFTLLMLRDSDETDRSKAGGSIKSEGTRGAKSAQPLHFPESLAKKVNQATTAYRRQFRVLLLGESGVGKTAMAKHIHAAIDGDHRPFVHVNCGSIPETLFESEMFGYERGAFTGALQAGKRGYIESATGGTLFLDEVGEIPISSQAKLLKFLEDGTIQPIGSASSKKIETRVIAATNRDLSEMTRIGTFRKDLLYRLSTFPVQIPLLRERSDKEHILDTMVIRATKDRGRPLRLSEECRTILLRYAFPGNLREMKSIVDYLDVVVEEVASPGDLPAHVLPQVDPAQYRAKDSIELNGQSLKDLVRNFEARVLDEALAKFGSKREVAKQLGVDVATVVRKTNRSE